MSLKGSSTSSIEDLAPSLKQKLKKLPGDAAAIIFSLIHFLNSAHSLKNSWSCSWAINALRRVFDNFCNDENSCVNNSSLWRTNSAKGWPDWQSDCALFLVSLMMPAYESSSSSKAFCLVRYSRIESSSLPPTGCDSSKDLLTWIQPSISLISSRRPWVLTAVSSSEARFDSLAFSFRAPSDSCLLLGEKTINFELYKQD